MAGARILHIVLTLSIAQSLTTLAHKHAHPRGDHTIILRTLTQRNNYTPSALPEVKQSLSVLKHAGRFKKGLIRSPSGAYRGNNDGTPASMVAVANNTILIRGYFYLDLNVRPVL